MERAINFAQRNAKYNMLAKFKTRFDTNNSSDLKTDKIPIQIVKQTLTVQTIGHHDIQLFLIQNIPMYFLPKLRQRRFVIFLFQKLPLYILQKQYLS